jgi:hypothetical protein
MRHSVLTVAAWLALLPALPPSALAQQARATEASARAAAERNRAERARQEALAGKPVALVHDYLGTFVLPVPPELGVSAFYQKYVDANGIPVLGSTKVPDLALIMARDIVNTMLSWRPDLRESLVRRAWRTGVIAETEMTMDIPEYANRKRPDAPANEPVMQADRDYHANRSRGLGGNPTTGAEENLLGYPGTRYFGEHIFVHEFAHAIHSAIRDVDPALSQEITAAYNAALAAGKYITVRGSRHYALTNAGEYWAEGVQWWFFSNYGECFTGNARVETPEEFKAYDPALFALIGRVFKAHRIAADVFHGRRVRPLECPSFIPET